MDYYTKFQKKRSKSVLIVIITIFILFNLLIIVFDKKVMPSVLSIAETNMRTETIKTINKISIEVFNEEVINNDLIIINKDKNNKINLIEANTFLLNKIASEISIRANEELDKLGEKGIKVPLGWMTDRSIYYNLGPTVTIETEPIGNIEVSYETAFESAGINQTRHKIYLNVNGRIKIIIPMYNREIEVNTKVPLSETIVVGDIPDTSIDFKNK